MKFKKKIQKENELRLMFKINLSEELKQDSIAHKIKSYFEKETITNMMLFKYDQKNKEVLVSKRQLIYLLSLCNDIEQLKDYNMKIVDNIDSTEVNNESNI